jgi:hypothetical protein
LFRVCRDLCLFSIPFEGCLRSTLRSRLSSQLYATSVTEVSDGDKECLYDQLIDCPKYTPAPNQLSTYNYLFCTLSSLSLYLYTHSLPVSLVSCWSYRDKLHQDVIEHIPTKWHPARSRTFKTHGASYQSTAVFRAMVRLPHSSGRRRRCRASPICRVGECTDGDHAGQTSKECSW